MLLAAGRPVTIDQILELYEEHQRPPADEVQAALEELAHIYDDNEHGIEVREVASGWRVQVRSAHADVVSRLWQERPSRYSRALLETLALIAYRQPITRSEIEDIRGVTVSSTIMRTLHERNWIRVVGHREVPGRPELLGTTREFLDYFGLRSLDDLPTLAELQDLDGIKEQLGLPGELGEEPALIAYRQPTTRGEIEDIRGVTVSSTIMHTLHERNWIRVVGHREVPGRPELLGTTREFLDYFGLKSLDDLPTLAEL
ncbi:MAG TPA: SMC-Scp complex subunit ScpB, partial [Kofleriaceae bacterium]|nr:SMC-Scp complex subunit ScpB [Kofleriaceae bacterium]